MITQYEMELRPNSFLISILAMLFLSAFMAIVFLDIFFIFKIALVLVLIFYGIYVAKRYIFLSHKNSIRKIYWARSEGWRLVLPSSLGGTRDDGDSAVSVELLNSSIFTSKFLLLNFKIPSGKICTAIILLTKNNHFAFRQLIRIYSFAQNAAQ
jgi:hypothetical protein